MAYVHVDPIVLDRLRTSGMPDAKTALLLHRAAHAPRNRPQTALRLLECMLQARLTPVLDPGLASIFSYSWILPPVLRRAGSAVATLDLGGHLAWHAGAVLDSKGVLPTTMAQAAVGRRLGDVLTHHALDPDAVIEGPHLDWPHAVFDVPYDPVALRTPWSPIVRLRTALDLLRFRRREKDTGVKFPLRIFLGASAVMIYGAYDAIVKYQGGTTQLLYPIVMVASMLMVCTITADFLLGHLIVELPKRRISAYEHAARFKHDTALDRWRQERGFDDKGAPLG